MNHTPITGNVIVGQSGGPTAVINASLAGVYKTAKQLGADKVYGMRFGIQGLLEERYIDMSVVLKNEISVELLKQSPSAFLGSCRYKLPEPVQGDPIFEKIFAILQKLDVKYFFYIGGNDSMDTIRKLHDYGAQAGSEIRFIGIPKTIDNDLMETDHTPGYGSAAKYVATMVKELIVDARVYDMRSITVVEIMGRNAGWLTASSALSRAKDCPGPDFIYLPELPFSLEKVRESVEERMKTQKSVFIAMSEGVKDVSGAMYSDVVGNTTAVDAFGHKLLSGAGQHAANYLGRTLGCKVRSIELSSVQRCGAHMVSLVDVSEAFQVGGAAVKAAAEGRSGDMVILKRVSEDPYICVTDLADVHNIANIEKKVPLDWIAPGGDWVTEDFIRYAQPLIQSEVSHMMINGLPGFLTMPEGM